MHRRQFSLAALAAWVAGCTKADFAPVQRAPPYQGALFIPGYKVREAVYRGAPALQDPHLSRNLPAGYDGPLTMLTRIDAAGDIRQAIFPIVGHDVAVSPDGRVGVFASMEGERFLSFDARSLDVIAEVRTAVAERVGGGHAVFLPDGRTVAVTERAPRGAWRGQAERHFGSVSLYEARTLRLLGRYSSHGIAPHEARLLPGGQHLAIAHYGSTWPPGGNRHALPRHTVEPSLAVVELASGRLVEKHIGAAGGPEIRHLTAAGGDLFAIQVAMTPPGDGSPGRPTGEADRSRGGRHGFRPAPVLMRRDGAWSTPGDAVSRSRMLEGLSIEYDPRHGEVVASFPAANRVVVFDAETGAVTHETDTAKLGLSAPCGVAMLGDSPFYAVAGYYRNLFVFERGSHRLRRDLCQFTAFWGHSHIAAA